LEHPPLCYDLARVRILLDYRPALRQRTGVGQYAHGLAVAVQSLLPLADSLILFSSSWKDRLPRDVVAGAVRVDARIPVSALNFAWHRLEWPPVDLLSGPVDLTHAQHPLMVPCRDGARVITIHDLYFLDHPEETTGEIRRDYVRLAASHARRADAIVVSSEHTRRAVIERFGVDAERVTLCYPGAPDWEPRREPDSPGPILFVGTVGPRKNLDGLLKAYAVLHEAAPAPPDLIVAGRITPHQRMQAMNALAKHQAAKHVRYPGYISDDERMWLYEGASMLVIPSFEEGFGLTALEAMTIGLPVVAARRGSLPEVLGDAALFFEPDDHAAIAGAMREVLDNPVTGRRLMTAGLARSRTFRWHDGAARVYRAYQSSVGHRRSRA
jgi:glycosyltransferase involved in cell wall biosynthesis